jgi:hypothetical protein
LGGTELSGGQSGFASDRQPSADTPVYIEHNSKIDAQVMSSESNATKSSTPVKKGLGVVASPAEVVGTVDALVRLDSNGYGRIDQVEIQKGIRASETTSTFAALTQYQKPISAAHKISETEDFMPVKMYDNGEVKVDKVFEDKMFSDERMYQDLYETQHNSSSDEDQNPLDANKSITDM